MKRHEFGAFTVMIIGLRQHVAMRLCSAIATKRFLVYVNQYQMHFPPSNTVLRHSRDPLPDSGHDTLIRCAQFLRRSETLLATLYTHF
jgi:hypothetical protein